MTIEFRKLKMNDTYEFKKWGKHDDPRFYQYNFPYSRKEEFDAWYFSKQKLITRKVYGFFVDDYPMGFITLKHINWFKKTAELGVAIDPSHVDEGYGTEMIKRFLSYVFEHYPIETMKLKVSHFNKRAQKSYMKIGFEKTKEVHEPFEEQSFKEIVSEKFPDQFDLIEGVLYTTFYVMQISKSKFQRLS